MLPAATREPVAVNRLAHARVAWILSDARVPHLFIKGVTTADLLTQDRTSGDVDVLVAPEDSARAVAALEARGLHEPLAGSSPGETALHSRTLRSAGGPEVDVHHHFPGLDADPARTWEVLSARAQTLTVAGHPITVPDQLSRVLLLALAAARDGKRSRAAADFAAGLPLVELERLRELAADLDALGPLRAGVWTLPDVHEVEARLRLTETPVPTRWLLMSEGDSSVHLRWQELREASWPRRIRLIARELVPTRSFMATYDPRSTRGWAALLGAHWRRWRKLAHDVPRAARQVREQAP